MSAERGRTRERDRSADAGRRPAAAAPAATRQGMTRRDQSGRILWARRWPIVAGVLLFTLSTYLLVSQQTPVYEATAKMGVTVPEAATPSFDQVQALSTTARTLVDVIDSRNVADVVVSRLSFPVDAVDAVDQMSFEQVADTQLISITAADPSPARARELAQTWADTFEDYAYSRLRDISPSRVLVADKAVLPLQPAQPRPLLSTAVALLLSTAVGCGLALLYARFDTRLSIEDLPEVFGVPVLGVLPRRGTSRASVERFEESVRVLRTNLQYATETPLQMVAVTSTRQSEGKSTVTAELARSFALLTLTQDAVLAVDADLRRPMLLERLGLVPDHDRGFTSYLRGSAEFDAAVQPTELLSLSVLPPGPLPGNPSTLLGFASSRRALLQLSEQADLVLIDTPPVVAGADAAVVATEVDGVIVVVDLAQVRREELRRTVDGLLRVRATVLGFVVNRFATDDAGGAYYYQAAVDRPDVEFDDAARRTGVSSA